MEQTIILQILGTTALTLLVVVTGGVAYLTISGWRDKRRQEIDRKR